MKKLFLISITIFISSLIMRLFDMAGSSFFTGLSWVLFLIYCALFLFSQENTTNDKLNVISWTLILTGVFFKLHHYPFIIIILLSGIGLQFIYCNISSIKNQFDDQSLVLFLRFICLIYFLFRLQYWPRAQFVFLLVAGLALVTYFKLKTVKPITNRTITTAILVSGVVIISFIRTHHIFYYLNTYYINNKYGNEFAYTALNKYSWFLYTAGKTNEALNANTSAYESISNIQKTGIKIDTAKYFNNLRLNRVNIQKHTWIDYDHEKNAFHSF